MPCLQVQLVTLGAGIQYMGIEGHTSVPSTPSLTSAFSLHSVTSLTPSLRQDSACPPSSQLSAPGGNNLSAAFQSLQLFLRGSWVPCREARGVLIRHTSELHCLRVQWLTTVKWSICRKIDTTGDNDVK